MRPPRLRDRKKRINVELYPIGDFPQRVIYEISRWGYSNLKIIEIPDGAEYEITNYDVEEDVLPCRGEW